jgi:hypothetical protein
MIVCNDAHKGEGDVLIIADNDSQYACSCHFRGPSRFRQNILVHICLSCREKTHQLICQGCIGLSERGDGMQPYSIQLVDLTSG